MINLNEKTRSLIRQSVLRTDICRMNESWRYPQALSWLFEYEKKYGCDEFFYVQKIDALLGMREFDQARTLLEQAYQEGFQEAQLGSQMFRILIYYGKYDQAYELMERMENIYRQNVPEEGFNEEESLLGEMEPSSLIIKGTLKAMMKDYPTAISMLEDAMLENYDITGSLVLGLCYILDGSEDRGLEIFMNALDQDEEVDTMFQSIMPNKDSIDIHNEKQVLDQAEFLFDRLARFAFDIFDYAAAANEEEHPDFDQFMRERIEEDPKEALLLLEGLVKGQGEIPPLLVFIAICYEKLNQESLRIKTLRKILNYTPKSAELAKLDLIGQLYALHELDYSKSTVKKHLKRLYSYNRNDFESVDLLIREAAEYEFSDFRDQMILNIDFEQVPEDQLPRALSLFAEATETWKGMGEEAAELIFKYRHHAGYDNLTDLLEYYMYFDPDMKRFDRLTEEFLPDPEIIQIMLELYEAFGLFDDYARVLCILLDDSTRQKYRDNLTYKMLVGRYGPAGTATRDVLLQEHVRMDVDPCVDYFMTGKYSKAREFADPYPFIIDSAQGISMTDNKTPCNEQVAYGPADLEKIFPWEVVPEDYQEDMSEENFLDFDRPISSFEKMLNESGLDWDEITHLQDTMEEMSNREEKLYKDVHELIFSDIVPAELRTLFPVILTDPHFIDETRRQVKIQEPQMNIDLGLILMFLARDGIVFPQGYQQLEQIIMSNNYRNLYDAGAEILKAVIEHIDQEFKKQDPKYGQHPFFENEQENILNEIHRMLDEIVKAATEQGFEGDMQSTIQNPDLPQSEEEARELLKQIHSNLDMYPIDDKENETSDSESNRKQSIDSDDSLAGPNKNKEGLSDPLRSYSERILDGNSRYSDDDDDEDEDDFDLYIHGMLN